MANTQSAKKNVRKMQVRTVRNTSRLSTLKTTIKKLKTLLGAPSCDQKQAEILLRAVAAQLARAKSKKVIHANTASRRLSRLAHKVSALCRQPESTTSVS